MAINFTDSPSNGATQVIGGRTYTYNSAKNKWDTTATEVTGPTATVYASVDNLPTSGNITGSQAFVSGTNRLYIWNGSGWYNIALINNTPTISGVSSSYALAIDGTATTVTITATDPEGLPITYSIASDTSGNTATVTQGTGSNTNIFTITPSTNTAHAGTFSLTFRASDGVNLATAVSSFTLQFSVQNSRYTTALITSVGANNAVNTTFDDKSTSNHTITANGEAHQTTFSPYRHGGYSTYFDGSGDNLTTASAILSSSGAFTVQCWVYLDDTSNAAIWAQGTSGNSQRASLSIEAGNWYAQIGSAVVNTTAAVANAWKFLEFQYDGSQIELFVDGTSVGTASNTTNAQNTGLFIGKLWAANYDLQGYVTDFRVINGTPAGSSTVPTGRFTAVTNTSLLACHLPYIVDGSTNGHTITVNGNTSIEPFAPYDAQEYSAASHGGSIRLDGAGDTLTVPSTSTVAFGAGTFTVEAWVYIVSAGGAGGDRGIFQTGGSHFPTSASNSVALTVGANKWSIYANNTSTQSAATYNLENKWYHVAVVRSASTTKLYVNGVEAISVSDSTNYTGTYLGIGAVYGAANAQCFNGSISDFRVVKGTAVYTSAFTPPTAPLTAITNTSLLLNGTDAGIIDKAQAATAVSLSNGVKSSTTQTKYLTSSIDFTSSLAYLQPKEHLHEMFAGDYTIEAWIWSSAINNDGTNNMAIIDYRPFNTNGQYFSLWAKADYKLGLYINSAYRIQSNTLLTNSTWHHIAISRQSGATRMFIDGTLQTQNWTDSTNYSGFSVGRPLIGNSSYHVTNGNFDFNGYMSDIRFTKGLARYTSNFTPPSAALAG